MASRAERVEAAARALVEIVEDVDAADVIEECVLVPVKDWDLIRAALALPADEATRADAAGAEAVAREAHKAARAEALEEVAEAWAVANAQLGCPVGTGLEDGCASCSFALLMKDAIKALKDEEPA